MSKKSAWSLYTLFRNNLYPFNLGMASWFNKSDADFTTVDISSSWVDPETNMTVKPVSEIGDFDGSFPIFGSESLMSKKEYGTCVSEVQDPLKYGASRDTANRICCKNRHYAEHFGYAFTSSIGWEDFLKD